DRTRNRRKGLELLRPLVERETIPEAASNSGDARETAGKIAKADGLDEIVKPIERRAGCRKRRRFAPHGHHKKDGCARQGRIDALRVDRHSVPVLVRHYEMLRLPAVRETQNNARG